ncbi:hypothetical protein ICE98_01795 [Lactococcus lactis]|nr:hypothetical protein [Lactococcus lactis]
MSDEARTFSAWSDGGLFWQVLNVENLQKSPENWTKWTLPGFRYFVVETTTYEMNKVYSEIENFMAHRIWN